MKLSNLFLTAFAIQQVSAIGFALYKQIDEGKDNSAELAYEPLDRSNALFLYIQIIAGADHKNIIRDFKQLCKNYGDKGVKLIPRVRYGKSNGDIATEPDEATLMADVAQWADVYRSIRNTIEVPVVQAGFLGEWGEWHDGPFCQAQGAFDTPNNQRIKKRVADKLLESGHKIALRYPNDHMTLYKNNRTLTIHNDCIFNEGPGGTDGWTFPPTQYSTLVEYTIKVASGNTYGGEPCSIEEDNRFDWTDYKTLCGSNGLIKYINDFQISYLNPYNPPELKALFEDPKWRTCSDNIQHALEQYK